MARIGDPVKRAVVQDGEFHLAVRPVLGGWVAESAGPMTAQKCSSIILLLARSDSVEGARRAVRIGLELRNA